MKVLLLIVDGLSPRHVRPDVTPALCALAARGGHNVGGGMAVLPSTTYPNHATFATGAPPSRHGIWASRVPRHGRLVPAWEAGCAVPTIFDDCRAAGRSSVAVLGDHHLVGTMGAAVADRCWPDPGSPAGAATVAFGPEVALDAFGYADDAETGARIGAAVADGPDLVVAQLNGPDTAAHLHGPDTEAAMCAYRHCDRAIAAVADALSADWASWAVFVVSDHGQEDCHEPTPIDLERRLAAGGLGGPGTWVMNEETAAVVQGPGAGDWAPSLTGGGVEAAFDVDDHTVVLSAAPGYVFGPHTFLLPGIHGSIRTARQVAVTSGGHPAARRRATWVERVPPPAEAWCAQVRILLGLGNARRERSDGEVRS